MVLIERNSLIWRCEYDHDRHRDNDERDLDCERDFDRDSVLDLDRDLECDRNLECDFDRDLDRELDTERDNDRDFDWEVFDCDLDLTFSPLSLKFDFFVLLSLMVEHRLASVSSTFFDPTTSLASSIRLSRS